MQIYKKFFYVFISKPKFYEKKEKLVVMNVFLLSMPVVFHVVWSRKCSPFFNFRYYRSIFMLEANSKKGPLVGSLDSEKARRPRL